MLGCENSHVNTFLNIMKEDPDKYRDINVIGVYSEDGEAMQKVADTFGVPAMRSYDEAVGKVVDVARLGAVQLIFENGEVAGVIVHVLRYGGTAVLFGGDAVKGVVGVGDGRAVAVSRSRQRTF